MQHRAKRGAAAVFEIQFSADENYEASREKLSVPAEHICTDFVYLSPRSFFYTSIKSKC
jgi:hypothetical protein